MSVKRKQWAFFCALVAILACCLLVYILSRPPSSLKSERPARPTTTTKTETPQPPVIHSGPPRQRPSDEVRSCFGVLVWPGMAARTLNYSRTILSWMEEWGFECGFVTAQGNGGKEASSPLPADVMESAWDLSEVSENLNSILLADGNLPPAEVTAVKGYLLSGGWAIMPTPEGGRISAEVEELIQLTPSRAATLMAPESPDSHNPLGAEEVRLLVSHSLAPGLAADQWLKWAGPPGKVLYASRDEALPLLCFRRPELPAVRLVPFGDGGIVHWNFPVRPGPLMEETELKTFLGDTLAWLFARANWPEPTQKEGSLKGIVREKEGQAIPDARVTAQTYSEWGQPVQSFEVSSSEDGEFTLPVVQPAVYWIKAEAEDYYQADMYLLARVKEGDRIEILMEPKGAIFGHAYYGPGEDHPAAGIPVTLAPNCRISSAWGRETVTDNEGRFSFDKLPSAQTFYLIARREGWLGMQEAALPLEGGNLELDIHLQTPFAVEGTTANAATGEPLAGVEVEARPWPTEGSRFLFADALTQTTTSGQEGKFTLMLPPGRWRLIGQAPGFRMVSSVGPGSLNSVVVLEKGDIVPSKPTLELCPHAALYGTVFQSSGEPAPRAKVTVDPGIEYRADEQGRYRTDPVPPSGIGWSGGPFIDFKVKAQWEKEQAVRTFSHRFVKEGDRPPSDPDRSFTDLLLGKAPLDVRLESPEPELGRATIAGTVLSEIGEPVPHATVELADPLAWPGGGGARPLKKTISDSEGEFRFSKVREGLWLIRARQKVRDAEGKVSLFRGEKWERVVEDSPGHSLEVRLGKAYIHGRVVKGDGCAMRNRRATFLFTLHTGTESNRRFFVEEDGGFSLYPHDNSLLTLPPSTANYRKQLAKRWKNIMKMIGDEVSIPWEKDGLPPPGCINLRVVFGWNDPKARGIDLGEVPWGEESLIVVLPPEGVVKGRVIDADTGSPVPNAGIGAYQNDRHLKSSPTDEEGTFSFSALPSGRCALGVGHDGYWIRWKEVEVVEGVETYIDIEIWTYWTIRGRLLLQETGEPVEAEIHTRDGAYVSGPDGRFALAAPARKGERVFSYSFTVPLEGTGLKSITESVKPDAWYREVDVGDIYVERRDEQD